MASLDSEGFSQVIAKELGLTQEAVVRGLANMGVQITSMEEFCCLKEKELEELIPNLTLKQRLLFRLLKKNVWKGSPISAAYTDSTPKVSMPNKSYHL